MLNFIPTDSGADDQDADDDAWVQDYMSGAFDDVSDDDVPPADDR